jgi:hypothetical protein
MPDYPCDCGLVHRSQVEYPDFITNGVARITVFGTSAVYVPRIWVVFHGLKAVDLPALARQYGWRIEHDEASGQAP